MLLVCEGQDITLTLPCSPIEQPEINSGFRTQKRHGEELEVPSRAKHTPLSRTAVGWRATEEIVGVIVIGLAAQSTNLCETVSKTLKKWKKSEEEASISPQPLVRVRLHKYYHLRGNKGGKNMMYEEW